MDSIDQCDPVLSGTLIRKMAHHVQETWKTEMDQLTDAVKIIVSRMPGNMSPFSWIKRGLGSEQGCEIHENDQ